MSTQFGSWITLNLCLWLIPLQLHGDLRTVRADGNRLGDGNCDVEHPGLRLLFDSNRYSQHLDGALHLLHLCLQEEGPTPSTQPIAADRACLPTGHQTFGHSDYELVSGQ